MSTTSAFQTSRMLEYEQNYIGTFLNSKTSILFSQMLFCKIDNKRYAFKIVQQSI